MSSRRTWKKWLLLIPLLSVAICVGALVALRPSRSALSLPLFKGVSYSRELVSTPRPLVLHRIQVELKKIRPFVTPGRPLLEVKARTTSEFLREFKVQVAINASIFSPCYSNHPLDYYPRPGDPVNISGQVIADGVEYSPPEPGWATLCFASDNRASIAEGACPSGTRWAVATTNRLLTGGVAAVFENRSDKATEPHPRAAVAIDKSGYQLELLAADGRQPFYSEGATLPEIAERLRRDGMFDAAALDGGGSVALVFENHGQPKLLNSPVHCHIPLFERTVGTHLGFFADPL